MLADRRPFDDSVVEEQLKSAGKVHVSLTMELGLKTPRASSAAKAIVIISITQPYVIRYSRAVCDLGAMGKRCTFMDKVVKVYKIGAAAWRWR
jgi:hypothetical protein